MKLKIQKLLATLVVFTIFGQMSLPVFAAEQIESETVFTVGNTEDTNEIVVEETEATEIQIEETTPSENDAVTEVVDEEMVEEIQNYSEETLMEVEEELIQIEEVITEINEEDEIVSEWEILGRREATTTSVVELGRRYVAPFNSNFQIEFTSLPEESGFITMSEVRLSGDMAEELDALDRTAYEITSTMEDGSFSYNLILPVNASSDEINVVYAENLSDLENAKETESTPVVIDDEVVIYGMDHFTIFVIVGTIVPVNTGVLFDDSASDVVINEFVFRNPEWVEIFNRTNADIDVTGWTITDEDSNLFATLNGTILANDFMVVEVAGDIFDNTSAAGVTDTINLLDNTTTLVSQVTYKRTNDANTVSDADNIVAIGNLPAGNSIGRIVDGGTSWAAFATVTKGYSNDITAPTSSVLISEPFYGPNTITTSTISGTANDDTEVVSVEITISRLSDGNYWNGTVWEPASTSFMTTGTTNWEYDGTGIAFDDGDTYTITPVAFDLAGNLGNGASDSFTWDSTNPTDPDVLTFASTTHTVGIVSGTDVVEVTFDPTTASDIGGSGIDGFYVEWNTDPVLVNGPVSKIIEETETTITSPVLDNGDNYLHLATVDNAGNWTSTVHFGPFVIDTDAPVVGPIEVITNYGSYVNGNAYRIRADVSDLGSGIDTNSCEYTVDGGTNWIPTSFNAGNQKCRIPVGSELSAPNGTVLTLNYRVSDNVGNIGYGTEIIRTADTDRPVTNSISIDPDNAGITNATPTITANITDATSPIVSCEYRYRINGEATWGAWNAATWDGGSNTCTYNPINLVDGVTYDFSFRGIDSVARTGGGGSFTLTRIVDGAAPLVTVDSKTTNVVSPELTGTIDDPTADIEITVIESIYIATNNGDGTWTLPAGTINPDLWEDVYEIIATATDEVGNVGTDVTSDELVIDLTTPEVSVNFLITKDKTPELTGTVNDPNAIISVTIEGTTYIAVNNGDGTWILNDGQIATNLSTGVHEVEVSAKDSANNIGNDSTHNELTIRSSSRSSNTGNVEEEPVVTPTPIVTVAPTPMPTPIKTNKPVYTYVPTFSEEPKVTEQPFEVEEDEEPIEQPEENDEQEEGKVLGEETELKEESSRFPWLILFLIVTGMGTLGFVLTRRKM